MKSKLALTFTFRWFALATLAIACLPQPLGAQAETDQRIERLEERILTLEAGSGNTNSTTGLPEWLEQFRISGSANIGFIDAETDSFEGERSFNVKDVRLFIDTSLGSDVQLGETLIVRDFGFSLELNAVRRSTFGPDLPSGLLGETYLEARGILDSDWLHLQAGRFQLPLGESYLRYSRGYGEKAFISNTVGGPWYWDEGVRFFGNAAAADWGYVASISDGSTSFNGNTNQEPQYTLKVYADPADWLHVSATGLLANEVGSTSSGGRSALWLGEMIPFSFGSLTSVPNFDGGSAVADGPNQLDGVSLFGADIVMRPDAFQQIWLAYGVVEIDSSGSRSFDRRVTYWIAEYVIQGERISPSFTPFYAGVRASGIGTYHDEEGYFSDVRLLGSLGYNLSSTEAYSAVVGWHLGEQVALRAEYTVYQNNVVSGVTPAIRHAANDTDYFSIELGISF